MGGPDLVTAKPLYSIESVASMIGATPAALRSWEERFGVVAPDPIGALRA